MISGYFHDIKAFGRDDEPTISMPLAEHQFEHKKVEGPSDIERVISHGNMHKQQMTNTIVWMIGKRNSTNRELLWSECSSARKTIKENHRSRRYLS